MKKFWHFISYLGVDANERTLQQKNIILNNRINGLMLCILILAMIVIRIDGMLTDRSISMGSIRVLLLIGVTTMNLFFSGLNFHKASRISLIFIPPFLITIFPTLVNFIEEESFVYYPYLIIAFSLIPQLILSSKQEPRLYWGSIIVFGLMTCFIDSFLRWNITESFEIIPIIDKFYVYYKLLPIIIFMFIHGAVFYLRSLNEMFETKIQEKNEMLDIQNEELKVSIDSLKQTQKRLIQAEKMSALGNLVSGVSYEINNPLNFIAGGLLNIEDINDILEMGKVPDKQELTDNLKEAEDMISKGIGRITKVIQLLSVFSGLDLVKQSKVNIEQVIDGTLYFKSVQMEGVIEVYKDYEETRPVMVYQDQIHEVFLHVFENAIEAILEESKKGNIFISTTNATYNEKKCVEVVIENNGPCINEDDLKKVFEPFFSINKDTMHSGLGLTAAYAIMKEHNGIIEINNSEQGVVAVLRFFQLAV